MKLVQYFKSELNQRKLSGGGFQGDTAKIPDRASTALAVFALERLGSNAEAIDDGKNYLSRGQLEDGRVPYTEDHPDVIWPTALALIAWKKDHQFKEQRNQAVNFLLNHRGATTEGKSTANAHDGSIPGWAWIDGTYSWIEPTSLAVIALKFENLSDHPAVRQGIKLVMDRRIESGGWNYGNKRVFGTNLLPMPESTGIALCALKDENLEKEVQTSLEYLESVYPGLKTPLSLARTIYGLSAFGRRPEDIEEKLSQCLKLQKRYGPFSTQLLAELAIAYTGSILSP